LLSIARPFSSDLIDFGVPAEFGCVIVVGVYGVLNCMKFTF
jgi:hypothetical protein